MLLDYLGGDRGIDDTSPTQIGFHFRQRSLWQGPKARNLIVSAALPVYPRHKSPNLHSSEADVTVSGHLLHIDSSCGRKDALGGGWPEDMPFIFGLLTKPSRQVTAEAESEIPLLKWPE